MSKVAFGHYRDSERLHETRSRNGVNYMHSRANALGIAIVVIHHVRKAKADDRVDTRSGSTGLTAAADATLVPTRATDGKMLYGRGRDLTDFGNSLGFDLGTIRWSDLGRPCDSRSEGLLQENGQEHRPRAKPSDHTHRANGAGHAPISGDICAARVFDFAMLPTLVGHARMD